MKKVVLILALVVTAGASVYAFDKTKGRKARKEAERKEMKCYDKEMAKECKKEEKSCCQKKAE